MPPMPNAIPNRALSSSSCGNYQCASYDSEMCGSCKKILELDAKVKKIHDTVLAVLAKERYKLLEEANVEHDRIRRLPLELIARIFELCTPDDIMELDLESEEARLESASPLFISAVCKGWRNLAQGIPRLWQIVPLHLQPPTYGPHPASSLVKEWIQRAGNLPLSISLFVNADRNPNVPSRNDTVLDVVRAFNEHSARWLRLKYEGPATYIKHFSSAQRDLLLLRDLELSNNDLGYVYATQIHLRPQKIDALRSSRIVLKSMNFDWSYLTRLELGHPTLDECFQVLRRTPSLTKCAFLHSRPLLQLDPYFPLPDTPIVHDKLRHLHISSDLYIDIFEKIVCPSLKTLELEIEVLRTLEPLQLPIVLVFLKTSGCLLESLSIYHFDAKYKLPETFIESLCEGIPTLQNLCMGFFRTSESVAQNLFKHLAEFSTVDGKKTPKYLPVLRTLAVHMDSCDNYKLLPDICGPPGSTAYSTERLRPVLHLVRLYVINPPKRVGYRIKKETVRRIAWLQEAGMKWEVKGGNVQDLDLLALAVSDH